MNNPNSQHAFLALVRGFLLTLLAAGGLLACLASTAHAGLNVGDKFGSWSFSCTAVGVDKTRCGMVQVVAAQKTGKNIVKVVVGYLGKNNELVLIVHTPMNIFLDTSVLVKVDQGKQIKMALQRCQPEACIAALQIKPEFFKELSSGSALKVGFVLWSDKKVPVIVPVPLTGLAEGMAKIKKETVPVIPQDGKEPDLML
ncbi:MAG: invasion associated locus B family protein [Magnetococcales bacterium]|nr:invasion associated locus B family protein [Magnetococcales bacterium]